MRRTTGRPLAELVSGLLDHERLSIAQVMRFSGVARNTINWIRNGRITHPERHTIQSLARAFATDPATRVVDEEKMMKHEGMLNAAAGYADPTADQTDSLLELALYYQLQHLPKAREWTRTIEALAGLSIEEIRQLREHG